MCKFPLNGKCLHWKSDSPSLDSNIIFRSTAAPRVSERLRCQSLSQCRTAKASYPATAGKCFISCLLGCIAERNGEEMKPQEIAIVSLLSQPAACATT